MRNLLIILGLSLFTMGTMPPPATKDGQWRLSGLDSTTIFAMGVHKGNIYAGTAGKGIHRSTDNGRSWSAVNNGLGNLYVRSFLSMGETLLAGTKNGVYKSSDKGNTWLAHNTGMTPNITIFSLLSANGNLYAGAAAGVYKSGDGGNSWVLQQNGFTGSPYVYALAVQGNNLYAGTQDNSVMKSGDGGVKWVSAKTGIPAGMTISSLYVVDKTTLLCGTDGAGCYASSNQAENWQLISHGITSDRFFGLSANEKTIYGGALNKVFKSMDKGVSWMDLTVTGLPPKVSVNNILVHKDRIFLSTETGVYCYDDDN